MAKAVLARISANGDRPFTAGLLFVDNKCVIAAPILRAAGVVGKDGHQIKTLCDHKGWTIERVPHHYTIVDDHHPAPNSLSNAP